MHGKLPGKLDMDHRIPDFAIMQTYFPYSIGFQLEGESTQTKVFNSYRWGFAAEDARGPAAPGAPSASARANGDDADAACSTHAAPGAGAAAHAGAATHAGEQRCPH